MKFGVFDHLDANGRPLNELFESRLKLIERYEAAGLYAYHLAEHHATPLGMAASPSVFLAAIAQRTKRILFGPMVYTLAIYHPLRLAEEICMLDHLSNGRLQLGIGRGISPIELTMYGTNPADAPARYVEATEVILRALSADTKVLNYDGKIFQFRDVPLQMTTLQQPHPPLWYGISNPAAARWAAENDVNVMSLQAPKAVRGITDQYRAEWAKLGKVPACLPFLGVFRHTVIAPSDEEALAIARRAYSYWHKSFWYLWNEHNKLGVKPPTATYPESFDELLGRGQALAGSPATVRTAIREQADQAGLNYMALDLAFGDIGFDDVARSVDLFAREVMPAFG
ncbi:MAG: LLM class flavin-dependent oxidoreductase [Burkholderiales bacterium]